MTFKRRNKNLIAFLMITALILSVFSSGAFFFDALNADGQILHAPNTSHSMSGNSRGISLFALGAVGLYAFMSSSSYSGADGIYRLSFDKNTKHIFKGFFDNSYFGLLLSFGLIAMIYIRVNEKIISHILDSDGGK